MKARERLALAIATGLHMSYIPIWLTRGARFGVAGKLWTGSGIIGTALGAAALPLLPEGGWTLAGVLLSAAAVACWASGVADRLLNAHDDPRIIVDEIVGYWFAVAYLPRQPWVLAGGFLLFRVLDVVKLPPYRALERLPGGLGVVADDLGAGLCANILLRLCLILPF